MSSMLVTDAAKMLSKETGHSERRCYLTLRECRGHIDAARRELQATPSVLQFPDPNCPYCKGKGEWRSKEDLATYRCPCTEKHEGPTEAV